MRLEETHAALKGFVARGAACFKPPRRSCGSFGEESDRPPSKDPCFVAARAAERGAAGLPIGVQVAARPWRDHVALAAMATLERDGLARSDYPRTPVPERSAT